MQTEKQPKIQMNPRKIARIAAGVIALFLVIALCISIIRVNNMQNEYASARNALGDELRRNLKMFMSTYDNILLAGADVEGTVLPAMRDYYDAALTVDTCIGDAFGENYRLLNTGLGNAIESAFSEFDTAFRVGKSTSDALNSMSACIQSLETAIAARFGSDDALLPA